MRQVRNQRHERDVARTHDRVRNQILAAERRKADAETADGDNNDGDTADAETEAAGDNNDGENQFGVWGRPPNADADLWSRRPIPHEEVILQ